MKFRTLTTVILLSATSGLAQDATTATTTTTTTTTVNAHDPNGWWANHWNCNAERYNADELTLDLFGSYLANQRKIEDLFHTNIRNGSWGGGVGTSFFFLRYLGIGGDINIPDNGGNFVDSINGSLIARLPICNSGFAPYVFGGGGRQTQPAWQWTGQAGVGMEYRFNPLTGIFVDTRYTWADKTSDTIYFRAGVRFVF